MLSKEEIENSFTRIETTCKQEVCLFNQPIVQGNLNQIKRYIIQLESREQKLIEKLEEDSKQLEHDILTMSIDTGNKYSLKLIHQAEGMKKQNDRILEILKKE